MGAGQGKVIITAAITGGVHVPTQSPYLPITPDQIVEECVRAHEAGAAVAHVTSATPRPAARCRASTSSARWPSGSRRAAT